MRGNIRAFTVLLLFILAPHGSGQGIVRNRVFKSGLHPASIPEELPLVAPRLFWHSGEFLDGSLLSADDHAISFQSPLFAEHLQVRSSVLAKVEFPTVPSTLPRVAFVILLKNGDRLFADFAGVEDDHLNFRSERHGNLRIPPRAIQSIMRIKGGNVLYQGPNGTDGWKHYGLRDAQGFPWTGGERGTLTTRVWNRSAMLDLPLPERVEIDLVLSSTKALRFAVCLGQAANSTQLTAVETWQDEVVIAQQSKFTPLLKLPDEALSLALRVLWDRTTRLVRVHDWAGTVLGEFQAAEQPAADKPPLLVIRNKGVDLTVERLCVRTWDGHPIQRQSIGVPTVQLLSGEVLEGPLTIAKDGVSLACGDISVPPDLLSTYDAGPDGGQKLDAMHRPLAQVLIPVPSAGSASRVRYQDGTILTGDLIRVLDGVVSLRSLWSPQPLNASLAGMSRLTLNEAAPAGEANVDLLDPTDLLTVGSVRVHGRLEGTGDATLRWRVPGAIAAVPLNRDPQLEIQRTSRATDLFERAPALFFLKDGNVLGARWSEVTAEGVKITSRLAETSLLEGGQLNAVHFNRLPSSAPGFSDPAWLLLKGRQEDAVRTGHEKVLLKGGAALGHPTLLAGNEISFTLTLPGAFGALAVDLFTGDLESHTKATQLHLIYSGTDFWANLESGDTNSRGNEQIRNLTGRSIDVRLQLSESSLHVMANGLPLLNAEIPSTQRKGTGLIFSPSLMWGNPARDVEISNLVIKARPDFVQVPHVSEESKRQTLTIPRFRRTNPPTQVLLAPNGDLLRGRIDSATENVITLSTGGDQLQVPVERVVAVVWLNPPKAGETSPTSPSHDLATTLATHWLILQDGSRLGVNVDRFEADHIVAWAPTLGTIKIPNTEMALLKLSPPPPSQAMIAYQDWQTELAPEPVLPETGGQSSPLLGKAAPDFALPLLGGGQFSLSAEKGKVVVLDFWATWCGPCVISMPEQLKAIALFDPAKVKFVGVNQGEPDAQVTRFLATRGWQLTVAMDSQQDVGKMFGVEGIPHCVVIGPDGKVAWTSTGYTPGDSQKMAAAVKKLLGGG